MSWPRVPEATITLSKGFVVARAQHRGQGDQPHRGDRGSCDTGGGCHQAADQHHRQGQAAAELAQQLAHVFQQPFGDARDLQHRPHEHEGGNRQQREVKIPKIRGCSAESGSITPQAMPNRPKITATMPRPKATG